MSCKHVPRPELKPGDLIAHFQWNYGWGNWEQVIPEAAGKDGVVAAYCAPAATASPESEVAEALERLVVYTAMEDAQLATNCEAIIKAALSNRPGPSVEEVTQAIRSCPSLDENGYITEKSEAIKAIRALYQKGGER